MDLIKQIHSCSLAEGIHDQMYFKVKTLNVSVTPHLAPQTVYVALSKSRYVLLIH